MEGLDTQIALAQARLTSAVRNGEPENSPQVRQMAAQLERMRHLWTTHRRIRLGPATSEGEHVSRIH
jgi:hypothetical protein